MLKMILTKSSKILSFKSIIVLCLELVFRTKIVAYWVSLCECFRCLMSISLRVQILTHHAFDMSSIPWYLLPSDHVVWATCPCSCISRIIWVDFLVFVVMWSKEIRINSQILSRARYNIDWMFTTIAKDISLCLSCSISKTLIFRWHMSGITWHVHFLEFSWSY